MDVINTHSCKLFCLNKIIQITPNNPKNIKFFSYFSLIAIVLIHAKTGFIIRNYGEKIPKWDNTRELLDWGNIAEVLTRNLPQRELGSLATLNWYDSGQQPALDYEQSVGVIGPNSNHFKYINLMHENFATLIDVRLINHDNDFDLTEKMRAYGYKKKIGLNCLF